MKKEIINPIELYEHPAYARIVTVSEPSKFHFIGCHIERRLDNIGLIQLRAGRSLVDLVPVNSELGKAGGAAPSLEGRNVDHFCFRIDPFDVADITQHLTTFNIKIGSVEMRYGAEGQGPSIYIEDPEKNTIELKGPPAQQ